VVAQYGGHTDREPTDAVKARLEAGYGAAHAIRQWQLSVWHLRSLTLDPAYQLK
jgi:hypothetical protein